MLRNIFVHPEQMRLRTGWRLFLQFILLWLLLVFIAPLLYGLGSASPFLAFLGDDFLVSAIGIPASVFLARRWFDRRSFVSLGLHWDGEAVVDLLVGIFLPALLFGLIFLAEWGFGWINIQGFDWQTSGFSPAPYGYFFFGFILVGIYEELLSRGYQLQNLSEAIGIRWGVFVASAIFSVLHLANPSASFASVLGILAAGYFLAYPYLRTGSLWLSIGLHIGWNFFEGPIFGYAVSGLDSAALILHSDTGPALITGGGFGPEAGLIVLPALALGAYLVYLYTRGRKHLTQKQLNYTVE